MIARREIEAFVQDARYPGLLVLLSKYNRQIAYEVALQDPRPGNIIALVELTEKITPIFYQSKAFEEDLETLSIVAHTDPAYLKDYWSLFPESGPKRMCGLWLGDQHCRRLLPKHSNGRCQVHEQNKAIQPVDPELEQQWPTLVEKYGRAALLVKNVPSRLRQLYLDSLGTAGNNLSLFAEIAIATVRQQELLQRAWENDPLDAVREVQRIVGEAVQGLKSGEYDPDDLVEQLELIVSGAKGSERAWEEWAKMTELTRRLIESEQRRIVRAQEAVTLEELEELAIQQEQQIRLAAEHAARELAEGDVDLQDHIERIFLQAISHYMDGGRGAEIVIMEGAD
jgi:hypothetical protein